VAESNRVVELSMLLRAAAPDVWMEFVHAMQAYADEVTSKMLSSPVEALPKAQGMALQAREMASMLADAPKQFEKIQAARMRERQNV
jgi:hypothetical protein